jgi:isochorismate hydrolase
MKEEYFTLRSMHQKSKQMMAELKSFRESHRNFKFVPKSSALLVLDMQNFFLDRSSHAHIPSAKVIIPGLKKLISEYNDKMLPIIFTRHIHSHEKKDLMGRWWKDLIKQNEERSLITREFDTNQATTILKNQYDAFYGTDLENILRRKGITQVVITGVMTHLCCETTARSAFMRGFEVFFTIDGTATYNEEFHRATLLNLAHGFAVPVLLEELLMAFKE